MIENLIIQNLMSSDEYMRKTLPYIQNDYFTDNKHKVLFRLISNYVDKYNSIPNYDTIKLELSNVDGITEKLYHESYELLSQISQQETKNDMKWVIDTTEKFCQDKALYNAIMKSIEIMDEKNSKLPKGAIPKLLQDALGVTFDNSIGHDYIESALERYEFYHRKEEKIPFDLHYFNEITKGGISRKTLTVVLAGCVHPDTKVKIRFRKKE